MQRWEYCIVGPIKIAGEGSPEPGTAKRTFITPEGPKMRIIKNINDDLFITISKLGDEGWEMVGCGNVDEDKHLVYFKRQIAP